MRETIAHDVIAHHQMLLLLLLLLLLMMMMLVYTAFANHLRLSSRKNAS